MNKALINAIDTYLNREIKLRLEMQDQQPISEPVLIAMALLLVQSELDCLTDILHGWSQSAVPVENIHEGRR